MKQAFASLLVAVILPTLAHASEGVEITPFAGYGIGGSFEEQRSATPASITKLELNESGLGGLAVDWDITDETQYEFFFSQQQTELTERSTGSAKSSSLFDMNVSYFHVGGTVGFGDDRIDPYIVGTVGATHFDPKHSGHSSRTRFSLALGGGVKLFITDHLGFRFEGRGLGTLVNGDFWFYSGSDGTQIGVSGDTLWQFQLNAGLILKF